MFLTKDGVTFEATHPSEISRLKRAGYKEEKPVAPEAPEAPVEVKPVEKKTTKKDGE